MLEVVLALTIFGGAMAALSQLITVGYRSAVDARLQTQAVIRAEAKMAEVIANPILLQSTGGQAFEEFTAAQGQWMWSLAVGPWEANANMLALELTTTHTTTGGQVNAIFTLRRYIRDPQIIAEEQAEQEAAETEALQE